MPRSTAKSIPEYLAALPPDRRSVVEEARAFVRKHLPSGYEELFGYGMIMWSVPLKQLPDTYNGHPLNYVALAAQKNYFALYLMGAYGDPKAATKFREGFKKAGKKLDMGKSCVRFKAMDDLALDAVAEVVERWTPAEWIELYKASRKKPGAK